MVDGEVALGVDWLICGRLLTRDLLNLHPLKKIKNPQTFLCGDAHSKTKKYTRQESNLRPGFCASIREK
jgi:hypothetical protein